MYGFPVAVGLVPDLSIPVAAFAPDVGMLGAWLAVCAIGFLAVLPFAIHPKDLEREVRIRRAA